MRMADHFSRLFQRTVRQMDAHRLSKAKQRRLAVPAARRPTAELEMKKLKERVKRVEQARRRVNRREGPPAHSIRKGVYKTSTGGGPAN